MSLALFARLYLSPWCDQRRDVTGRIVGCASALSSELRSARTMSCAEHLYKSFIY